MTRLVGVAAVLVTVVVIALGIASAVDAQTRIDKWTTDNGLPQNSVTGLTQTRDGYLWLTTQEGLVRFDGLRFTVFNRSNTPAIRTNRMYGAVADERGRIWANSDQGDILVYENGVFTTPLKAGDIPPHLRSRFFTVPGGRVVFHTEERDPRTGRLAYKHYEYHDGAFVALAMDGIGADDRLVLADRTGGLWFGNGRSLRRFKNGETTRYDFTELGSGGINKFVYEDSHGSLWFGVVDGGAQRLARFRNGHIQSLVTPPEAVVDAAEDSHGNLWVTVYDKGVYKLDRSAVIADALTPAMMQPVLLTDRIGFGFLTPDREGGMWVGTNDGLVRLAGQTIRTFSTTDGLPSENVYPILQDRAGRIWAGTWPNSVVRYDNGRFTTVIKSADSYFPTALFEDRRGRFWLGQIGHLYYLDRDRPVDFTLQTGFPVNTEFSAIAEDHNGTLWFGTSAGLGRYADGTPTVFTRKDGLPDDYVVAVLVGRDGTVWVGTRGGLASITGGLIKSYTTADGLASNYIRSLYEDADGVLWIGSYDGGLTRLARGRLSRITMKDGLSSDGVFCILEDDRGWFWFNSNQGIYRVRKQQLNDFADGRITSLTSIAYTRQDGVLSVEGNGGRQPAGIKAHDGTLWFPTSKGIAVVNPATVVSNELPPPVLIEDLLVDGKPIPTEQLQAVRDGSTAIVLQPGARSLEIGYTAISFINSPQLKFKYRIDDLDREWTEVGTRRAAYYSYLPPGEYTFRVIAANRDGVWNDAGASIRVTALPPFYATVWFRVMTIGAVLLLLTAFYRLRVRQLAHRFNLALDARVSERTRIARELHDTLLQSLQGLLLQFQTASHLLSRDPAQAQVKLDEAIRNTAKAITDGRDAVQDLRTSTLERNDVAKAISALADELRAVQAGRHVHLDLTVEGNPRELHPIVRDDIYKIAAEALRNAFWHARANRVEVQLHYHDKQFRLRVRDDGVGIDPAVLAGDGVAGHYGLRGMRERAELIGGSFAIWSGVGAGTQIDLRLPAGIVYASPARHFWWSR